MNSDAIQVVLTTDNKSLIQGFNQSVIAIKNLIGIAGQARNVLTRGWAAADAALHRVGKAGAVVGASIGAGLALGTKGAASFEASMRNVNSITKLNEKGFHGMNDQVLGLVRSGFPGTAQDMASGLYDIASAGFSANDGLKVLKASSIAATAGVSDIATAADVSTSVLNAYGISASHVGEVNDILFKIVDRGKLTFSQLAESTAQWLPVAQGAQITLRDAGAAMAYFTANGFGAAEAATALASIARAFINPSDQMSAALAQLGVDSGTTLVQTRGLGGAIQDLIRVGGNSSTELQGMFQDAQALAGVLSITKGGMAGFNGEISTFNDKSKTAGAAQKAFSEQSKSLEVRVAKLKASLQVFGITIGRFFLAPLGALAGMATKVLDVISAIPTPVLAVGTALTFLTFTVAALGAALLLTSVRNIAIGRGLSFLTGKAIGAIGPLGLFTKALQTGGNWLLRVTGLGARFGPMVEGIALAAAGAATAITVGAAAWYLYGSAIDNANTHYQNWLDKQKQKADLTSLGGYGKLLTALEKKQKELAESGDLIGKGSIVKRSWVNAFRGAVEIITPLKNSVVEAGQAWDLNSAAMDKARKKQDFINKQLKLTRQIIGDVSNDQIVDMAKKLGIDLVDGGDKAWHALRRGFELMGAGQTVTGGLNSQIKMLRGNLSLLTEDMLKLTPAQQAMQSALSGMWGVSGAISFAQAQSDAEDHTLDVRRALLSQRQAAMGLADATKTLNDLRNPADILKVRDAELALRDAQVGQKDAAKTLRLAQEHLRKVRMAGRNASDVADAETDVERAQLGVDKSQRDVAKSQDDLDTARHKGITYAQDLAKAQLDYEQAVLGTMDAEQQLENARKVRAGGGQKVPLTAEQLLAGLDKQSNRAETWRNNLVKIAHDAGYDVAEYLAQMGEDGYDLVNAFANSTGQQFDDMATRIRQAAKNGGIGVGVELEAELRVAAALGGQGAAATVNSIADELKVLPDVVKYIGAKFQDQLKQYGLTAEMILTMGPAKPYTPSTSQTEASGPSAHLPTGTQVIDANGNPIGTVGGGADSANNNWTPGHGFTARPSAYGGMFERATNLKVGESGWESVIAGTKQVGHRQLAATAARMGYRSAGDGKMWQPAAPQVNITLQAPSGGDRKVIFTGDIKPNQNMDDVVRWGERKARLESVGTTGGNSQ